MYRQTQPLAAPGRIGQRGRVAAVAMEGDPVRVLDPHHLMYDGIPARVVSARAIEIDYSTQAEGGALESKQWTKDWKWSCMCPGWCQRFAIENGYSTRAEGVETVRRGLERWSCMCPGWLRAMLLSSATPAGYWQSTFTKRM